MRFLLHTTVFILFAFLSGGCNKNNVYEEKSRSLDSLSGVVNSALRGFEKNIDTILLEKCVLKFEYYREFIRHNVNDTLSKTEADNLRSFYSAGNNLLGFSDNRKILIQRITLLNGQLAALSKDIKEKLVEPERLVRYCNQETLEAKNTTDLAYAQQKIYQTSLEEFRNALKGVENLIRSRNNGELPVIIKDTVSL